MSLNMERICLTCLQESSSTMHKILDTRDDQTITSIPHMLQEIVPILVTTSDLETSSPKEMCIECVEKLTVAYNFQKMCLASYEKLQSLREENEEKEDVEMDVYNDEETLDHDRDTITMDILEVGPVRLEPEVCFFEETTSHDTELQCEEDTSNDIMLKHRNHNSYDGGEEAHNDDEEHAAHYNDDANNEESSLKELTCVHCHKVFKDNRILQQHLHNVHNINIYTCQICQYRFHSERSLKLHITNVHEQKNLLLCTICVCKNKSLAELVAHMKTKHPDVQPFKCEMCDKVFPTEIYRENHMSVHTGLRCKICYKTFKSNEILVEHLKIHEEKVFPCPECPQRFPHKSKLKNHMLSHTKERQFICNTCGSSFIRRSSLTKHERKHSGNLEKPFKCTKCYLSFTDNYQLKRHELLHTGKKEHKCSYCHKAYASKGDLIKHLRLHIGEKTYVCDECPEAFKYKHELRDHKNQHYKEKKTAVSTNAEKTKINEDDEYVNCLPIDKNQLFAYAIVNYLHLFFWLKTQRNPRLEGQELLAMSLYLDRICLTCLQESSTTMHKILDTRDDQTITSIPHMLQRIVPILVADNLETSVPKEMCIECVDKLTIAYNFQKTCLESYEKLQSLREEHPPVNMTENNVNTDYTESIEVDQIKLEPEIDIFQEATSDDNDVSVEEPQQTEETLTTGETKSNDSNSSERAEEVCDNSEQVSAQQKIKKNTTEENVKISCIERRTCPHCRRVFDTISSLNMHQSVHNEDNKYVCNICEYRYATNAALQGHIVKHEFEKILSCNLCDCKIYTYNSLAKHMRTMHPEVPPPKCEMCNLYFPTDRHLESHMRIHNGYRCNMCDVVYKSRNSLATHKNSVHNNASFVCPQCGKAFAGATNLAQHLKNHGEKTLQCTECPARFAHKSKLQNHILTHTREKPFICDICGTSFKRLDYLSRHQRKRCKDGTTIDRPFNCETCNMRFINAYSLKCHQLTHTGERKHACTYCDRAFKAKGDLIKHLRTHVGENTYFCDECPESFKYKNDLRDHKSQHYKEQQGMAVKSEEPKMDS
ncbi:uncharacterized protein [Musca autumnalis]|uniref:uncharacterized protein n=1 Tax=Musca autumnalis TaxID=221902 RepID=UPI003CF1EA85